MPCYHPIQASKLDDGSIAFPSSKAFGSGRSLSLPCGRCIGCRLKRQRAWAVRCMHESQMHGENSFVTLTYNDENWRPSLEYTDFQKFMRALRYQVGPTRFFMSGEYGELDKRPHFHALLFGRTFRRDYQVKKELYGSQILDKCWGHGYASFGAVTFESASYVAGYTCKKITGEQADEHYLRTDWRTGECVRAVPEFGRMSLRPGIGKTWFEKFWRDVYLARDGVCLKGGHVVSAPRTYDVWLEAMDGFLSDEVKFKRYQRALEIDDSERRLMDKEIYDYARMKFNNRSSL